MTDKEMAEEYAKGLCKTCTLDTCRNNTLHTCAIKEYIKQAHLVGLKAGRPQWHKVTDGDLPKAENHYWSRNVLFQTNKGSSIIGFYDHANKAWYEKSTNDMVWGVIAWCEIPEYIEE